MDDRHSVARILTDRDLLFDRPAQRLSQTRRQVFAQAGPGGEEINQLILHGLLTVERADERRAAKHGGQVSSASLPKSMANLRRLQRLLSTF